MSDESRDLGMERPIARRDFLNGIAGTAAAFGGAIDEGHRPPPLSQPLEHQQLLHPQRN